MGMFLFIIGQLDFGNNLLFAIYSVFMKLNIVSEQYLKEKYESHIKQIVLTGNSGFSFKINMYRNQRRTLLIVGNANSGATLSLVLLNSNDTCTADIFNFGSEKLSIASQSNDSDVKTISINAPFWSTYTIISLDRLSIFI